MSYTLRDNLSPFFTAGRPHGILGLVLHHGATTDFGGIGRTFKVAGVSAGYGVNDDQNVERYVYDSNIAYHAGDWEANKRYIGIEHVNSTGAPNWNIAETTFNTSIQLAYDLGVRHGFLPLVPFKNLFPHGHFTPTFCPGVLKARLQEYADAVNAKMGQPAKAPTPKPAPALGKKTVDALAREVIAGSWGNNPERANRLRASGYDPDAVQAEVNRQLGAGSAQAVSKSISQVAREVIAGSWGNGTDREANLKRAGYNYSDVQAEVNRQLGVGAGRPVTPGGVFAVGHRVEVTSPIDYNGVRLGVSGVYSVIQVNGDRIVIGRGGVVTAAMNKKNLRRV